MRPYAQPRPRDDFFRAGREEFLGPSVLCPPARDEPLLGAPFLGAAVLGALLLGALLLGEPLLGAPAPAPAPLFASLTEAAFGGGRLPDRLIEVIASITADNSAGSGALT